MYRTLILVPLLAFQALSQEANSTQIAFGGGIGLDLAGSTNYRNTLNWSLKFIYPLSPYWNTSLEFTRAQYKFHRLTGERDDYINDIRPDISRNLSSLFLISHWTIAPLQRFAVPYVSLGFGVSRSTSTTSSFDFTRNFDTLTFSIPTGTTLAAYGALGADLAISPIVHLHLRIYAVLNGRSSLAPGATAFETSILLVL